MHAVLGLLSVLVLGADPGWIPSELVWSKNAPDDLVLREHVYPLGFSKEGRFAYLLEPADEACGCYLATLVLMDLKTDVVLTSLAYSSDRPQAAPFAIVGAPPTDLRSFWKAGQVLFRETLSNQGIVIDQRPPAPSSTIRLSLEKTEPAPGVIQSYRLKGGATPARKTLAQVSFPTPQTRPLAVHLGGVISSPYGRRAAVLVIETRPGWEGPPHVERARFLGIQAD